MSLSLKKRLERENFFNTMQILQDLDSANRREFFRSFPNTGALAKADVSLVGFMGVDPNRQIAFAASEGLIPDDSL